MSKGKIALGALIGAAAGLVAGLLTAPKSGKETRADLKKRADELREQAADRAESAKTNLKERAEELRERGEQLLDNRRRD